MPRGIRGRKSSEKRTAVNVIIPKEWDPTTKTWRELAPSDPSINPCAGGDDTAPVRSAQEVAIDMELLAMQAAAEAEAAQAALKDAAPMKTKARKKLEVVAAEKAKEAKRLAAYASLAKHQAPPEKLKLLASSTDLGSRAHKERRRHEQAAQQHNATRGRDVTRDGRRDDRPEERSRSRSRDRDSEDAMDY